MPRYDEDEDDYRPRRDREREPAPSGETNTKDLLDLVGRRLSGAILGAGAMIAIGVYAGGSHVEVEAPGYQIIAQDGEVIRLNTESGTVIACDANRCMRVLDSDLDDDLPKDQRNTLFKTPAGQLPAPAQQQPAPANPASAAQAGQSPPAQPK